MRISAEYEWKRFFPQQHPVAGDYLKLCIEIDERRRFPSQINSRPFVCIELERFLKECEDFIERFLHSHWLRALCWQVQESVMSAIKKRFQFVESSTAIAAGREPQEFFLHSVIVIRDDHRAVSVSVRDITVVENENGPEIHNRVPMEFRELLKKSKVIKSDECCVICLEDFSCDKEEEEGYSIPCGHMFHYVCILTWLLTNHKCPMCRYSLRQPS